MIQVEGIFTGGSVTSAPIMGTDFTWTGGDNTCMVLDDGDGNWRIKFLSSGIFTPLKNMVIDVFLVGGGGPGGNGSQRGIYGGGAGGYTKTVRSIVLVADTAHQITVGAGGDYSAQSDGGTTSAFGASAAGGSPGARLTGGNGGSGGGASDTDGNGCNGGSDGSDGAGREGYAGKGQGTTTREFGDADGDLYSGGGGCASSGVGGDGGGGDGATSSAEATPGEDNKGGGGGGKNQASTSGNTHTGASGGSGICIIRNHREEA